MAVDKLVDSTQLDADLTSVANAIRTKGGASASLAFPAGFVSAINAIETGGGGGLTLLASGTYTKTGTESSLTIPVSYTGTPLLFCVGVKTVLESTGQAVAACKFVQMPADSGVMATLLPDGFAQARGRNASNAYGYQNVNANTPTLTSTTMTFARVSATYLWQPNDYEWYIYGEASS